MKKNGFENGFVLVANIFVIVVDEFAAVQTVSSYHSEESL